MNGATNTLCLPPGIERLVMDDDVLDNERILARRYQALIGGQCILLADDDASMRMAMRRQIALLGGTCMVATDGMQALRAWQQQPQGYWLVLIDLQRPPMDGFALARGIRSHSLAGARVPILTYTSAPSDAFGQHCRSAGIDECLPVPVPMPKLRKALVRWLPRRRVHAPVQHA